MEQPLDPSGGGGGGEMTGDVTTSAPAAGSFWLPIIERPYILPKGKLQAYGDVRIQHVTTPMTPVTPETSRTDIGLHLGAGYGVTDKITAGVEYAFTLHDFEIKGPLTLYGEYQLIHQSKLSVAASGDLTFDFGGRDSMGGTSVDVSLHAGLGARYLVAPKMAVYTGAPYGPGPVGQHLTVPFDGDSAITFDIPVGFAYQAMPQLFVYAQTQLLRFNLANKGGADTVVVIGSDAGGVPLTLGGLYQVTSDIDATAALVFPDLGGIGDKLAFVVGARWHN